MKPLITDDNQYIHSLIRSGEGQHLDFKYKIDDVRKIARSFSAFANTGGGKLLIGVKDNGKISGVKNEEEAYMAESAALMFCRPEVAFHLKIWQVEGKCVLEVDIPLSATRPHFAQDENGNWVAYVRTGDQNRKANRVLVALWKHEKKDLAAFIRYGKEERTLINYLGEHDQITFSKFMKVARINATQAEDILVNLIMMGTVEMNLSDPVATFRIKKDL